jgi:CRISPR-associated protein Cmr6
VIDPLPPGMLSLLGTPGTNPSLVFFRGYHEEANKPPADARSHFLTGFRRRFATADTTAYQRFVERRSGALEHLAATTVELVSTQPLVLGLGLPHPTETALILDRLTGSPFIPGSSLKGVLRHAAHLAADGGLAVDLHPDAPSYWKQHLHRIFGPPIGEGETPAIGQAIFYDAFPSTWPALALDILTPHHTGYYSDPSRPPGDWEEPTPVPFLTVEPGTRFGFAFGPRRSASLTADDLTALRQLLVTGLDWLGIGGKAASQGFGTFSLTAPKGTKEIVTASPSGRRELPRQGPVTHVQPPPPPTPKPKVEAKVKEHAIWKDHELTLDRGKATLWRGRKERAECLPSALPKDIRKALLKQGSLQVDAKVAAGIANVRRIVEIRRAGEDDGWTPIRS